MGIGDNTLAGEGQELLSNYKDSIVATLQFDVAADNGGTYTTFIYQMIHCTVNSIKNNIISHFFVEKIIKIFEIYLQFYKNFIKHFF
jgi:hypothetical protein